MTFHDVLTEYDKQFRRACQEWQAFRERTPYPISESDYKGFNVNYAEIDSMLIQAAMSKYGFSKKQAYYLHGETYNRHHASYDTMILEMSILCETIHRFNKLKG
jgi:hypothetical protein